MSTAELAAAKLFELLKDENPKQAGADTILVDRLAAVIRVRVLEEQARPGAGLVVSEVMATFGDVDSRIAITCVGFSSSIDAACGLAMGQWAMGVLPVLQTWRGAHSCFTDSDDAWIGGHKGERFKLIQGPVIELGAYTGEPQPASVDAYSVALRGSLEAQSLRRRLHWLECYAVRRPGEFDATCRLDNRDWSVGRETLLSLAKIWPGETVSMHSRRQFMLLIPEGDAPYEKTPGFWGRLFGKS